MGIVASHYESDALPTLAHKVGIEGKVIIRDYQPTELSQLMISLANVLLG
jgi:hypothetical protein